MIWVVAILRSSLKISGIFIGLGNRVKLWRHSVGWSNSIISAATYITGGSCTRLDFKLSARCTPFHYRIRFKRENPTNSNVLLFSQVCMRNVQKKRKFFWLCFAFLLISVNWHCDSYYSTDLLFNDIPLASRNEYKNHFSLSFCLSLSLLLPFLWIIRSLTKQLVCLANGCYHVTYSYYYEIQWFVFFQYKLKRKFRSNYFSGKHESSINVITVIW